MQNIGKMIRNLRSRWWIGLLVVLIAACSSLKVSSPDKTSSAITATPTAKQPTVPTSTLNPTAAPTEELPTHAPTEAATSPLPTITPSSVGSFPDPQSYSWKLVAEGFSRPVGLVNAGDGSGRLFIIEQRGVIRMLRDEVLSPEPYLDISDRTRIQSSEQGLLGLAFDPYYAENGKFYVNYTDVNGDTVIARYNVSSSDPNQADPASEERLLFIRQPFGNHNGGGMAFGPEGYLYLGLGDGGSANDPNGHGQSTNTHLGKLLRIDVNAEQGYNIPEDNPFVNGEGLPEIWAYGLRNPWRFSFDRLNGDLYIGDVGQNTWEEVDYVPVGSPAGASSPAGINFGWDYREGKHPFEGQAPVGLELVDPVTEYDHSLGCAVTGGFVYRGKLNPEWYGVYLFGDYCSGLVWGLLPGQGAEWQTRQLFETGASISSFGEDEEGEVYLVDYSGGVYQLVSR